jgi:hypothetical protein
MYGLPTNVNASHTSFEPHVNVVNVAPTAVHPVSPTVQTKSYRAHFVLAGHASDNLFSGMAVEYCQQSSEKVKPTKNNKIIFQLV